MNPPQASVVPLQGPRPDADLEKAVANSREGAAPAAAAATAAGGGAAAAGAARVADKAAARAEAGSPAGTDPARAAEVHRRRRRGALHRLQELPLLPQPQGKEMISTSMTQMLIYRVN